MITMVEHSPETIRRPVRKKSRLKKLAVRRRIDSVKQFTGIIKNKFGKHVKSVAVFGSFARGDFRSSSDIDVLVIIDDTLSPRGIPPEIKDKIHGNMQEIGRKIDKRLHVQLHLLSEYWEYIRHGDAIFFNYVREGVSVYDEGFFKPIKKLLMLGAVRPTREAVYKQLDGAEAYLKRVESYLKFSIERLFRAASWCGNGVLMAAGHVPVRPKEISVALREQLVKNNLLEERYVQLYEKIYQTHKAIEHEEITVVTPEKLAEIKKITEEFISKVKEITETFLKKSEKARQLEKKLQDTAKVFWLYKGIDKKGYAWVFKRSIYYAVYENKKLVKVMIAPVSEKLEVGKFVPVSSKALLEAMEKESDYRPIISQNLVSIILSGLEEKDRVGLFKVGVEFPGRALVDMTPMFVRQR
jgi:predicted nucleotidyltransferase/uncharacterized protein (UPF0332 family)